MEFQAQRLGALLRLLICMFAWLPRKVDLLVSIGAGVRVSDCQILVLFDYHHFEQSSLIWEEKMTFHCCFNLCF